MRKLQLWLLSFIMIFAIIMTGCEKTGDPAKSNAAPDTRILSYSISSVAELDTSGNPTSNYLTTIYISGSDIDGGVKNYEYSLDPSFPSASTGITLRQTVEISLDFALATTVYKAYIRAVDNLDTVDPTPASVTIQRSQGGVETQITSGPPNGANVSAGVTYGVNATSGTGTITNIQYRVNDGDWMSTDADDLGSATILITELPSGTNILSFAGERDDGLVDASPTTVSLVVRDAFAPILHSTSPVVDGGGWFEGVTLTFSWNTVLDHYYGSLPPEAYCFIAGSDLAPPAGYDLDSEASFGEGWSGSDSYDYDPPVGANMFYLKVRDTGGNCDTLRIRFGAAAPSFDEGILVVNGVHPATYGAQLQDKIDASAYWGTFNVAFWDLFGTMSTPAVSSLPASADYIGGGSQLSPDVMAKYSTIVWLGNEYNGDFPLWQLTPSYAYLQAGGNLILASRYVADFVDAPLTEYANVAWRDGSAAGSGAGSTIIEYEPIYPGLVSMEPFLRGMTATSVWSGGGFLDSTDDGVVTNWDGATGYSSDVNTTLLFCHRSDGYNADSPFAYVRGLGVWSHPNFALSDVSAGNEYPTAGTDEAKGNFIIISGRHYGFDVTATTTNYDFMLKNLCAEQ